MTRLTDTEVPPTVGVLSPCGQILTLQSETGIALDGVIYLAHHPKAIAVHIHGSLGNFYQNHFLRVLAREYAAVGISLLAINLRSHDGIAEAVDLGRGRTVYVGGSLMPFESCVADIASVVSWAEQWTLPVFLQGHSLGCDRVVAFVLERQWAGQLVLLSPCDSKELQIVWGEANGVDWQERMEAVNQSEMDEFGLLQWNSYGVVGVGDLWRYPIPASAKTLSSIMNGVPGSVFHLRKELSCSISNKGYCYIGADDEILTAKPEIFAERVRRLAPNIGVAIVEGGRHDLSNSHGWVCRDVCRSVSALINGCSGEGDSW
jgi:hypothetical protein